MATNIIILLLLTEGVLYVIIPVSYLIDKKYSLGTVKTAIEVEVRAIQDHKVIEWNTCWKCRLLEGTDDI